MEAITLEKILAAQSDFPKKSVDSVCDNVLNNTFDAGADPITTIIVNAFENNESGTDLDGMENDIAYAISQLNAARDYIRRNNQ